jgi:hypothetical protein
MRSQAFGTEGEDDDRSTRSEPYLVIPSNRMAISDEHLDVAGGDYRSCGESFGV